MPSSVLVQTPREEPRVSEADLGLRIVSTECSVDGVSLSRPAEPSRSHSEKEFEFNVEMAETSRRQDSLAVKYSFTFGRPSSGQVCNIRGRAVFRFSHLGAESDLHALGSEIDNEMAVEVFRKNFELVYLLHDALEIDAPSPWITQDVSLSSRGQTVR